MRVRLQHPTARVLQPQLYLGLTFNWGALLGWAATRGSLDLSVTGPLYLSGICWAIVYDTIYAHMDKKDDEKVGIKSTALLFGPHTKAILVGATGAMAACQSASGIALGAGPLYYAGVASAAAHALWQVYDVRLDVPGDCLSKFKSNFTLGGIFMSGAVTDRLLHL